MAATERSKAVVLLSGGMDSTTCLAMAVAKGHDCHALSFDYGQRHRAELDAAARLALSLGASQHRVITIGLGDIGGSALTDSSIPVPTQMADGIPVTYVPARNTVFLALALGWAEVLHAAVIYAGMNAVDYSGYPDCRPEYMDAFQRMANLATRRGVDGEAITVETPLMHLSKSEIIREGLRLGVPYRDTVSCYQASTDGAACAICDACRLRRIGFEEAGIKDMTRYV
jgi:7-cyano-7-deazaguanine synthase